MAAAGSGHDVMRALGVRRGRIPLLGRGKNLMLVSDGVLVHYKFQAVAPTLTGCCCQNLNPKKEFLFFFFNNQRFLFSLI